MLKIVREEWWCMIDIRKRETAHIDHHRRIYLRIAVDLSQSDDELRTEPHCGEAWSRTSVVLPLSSKADFFAPSLWTAVSFRRQPQDLQSLRHSRFVRFGTFQIISETQTRSFASGSACSRFFNARHRVGSLSCYRHRCHLQCSLRPLSTR